MKLGHLEALRPICPVCRKGDLDISKVVKGSPRELEEGFLECKACRHLFPVIDGIPILVRDLRHMVSEQILGIVARDDLSETILGALGECCGPSSSFDSTRQHVSGYAFNHWEEGSVARVLAAGLEHVPEPKTPILDVGCSVGRTTYDLARRGLVVGVDLNFTMLRLAKRIAREGRVTYARRESGLVYEERTVDVRLEHAERADFWCADALALPFREGTFGLAASLNLIDCLQSPLEHLRSLRDVLAPSGSALVATPFDWAPHATPLEQWLGGHSPHGGAKGRPDETLKALLGTEQLAGVSLVAQERDLAWHVRLHARAVMRYACDLFVLKKDTR